MTRTHIWYAAGLIAVATLSSHTWAQMAASIRGVPPATQYTPYGVFVPPAVVKDATGVVVLDQRKDRKRVAHLWKTFAHRLTPTTVQESIQLGSLYASTFWDIPSNWSGNLSGCVPGSLNPGIIEATVRQVNWFRSMAGLDPVRIETDPLGPRYVQAAALVQRVAFESGQGTSHNPAPNRCSGDDATFGSQISLLAALSGLTQRGPALTGILMDDYGDENYLVGHRRAILHPLRSTSFYGEASGPLGSASWFAAGTLMVRPTGATLARNVEVLWPTEGYFPYQAYPWISKRWSIACTNCDFTGATVKVKRNGVETPVKVEQLFTAYQDQPTLVWQLTGVDYKVYEPHGGMAQFTQDDVFDTTVTYRENGVAKTRTYRTTVFNPELETDNAPAYDVTEMYWDPRESGWGFSLIQGGAGDVFGTVYIYDDRGNPRWLTLQQTSWTQPGALTGTVYETRGPGFDSKPFDPSKVTIRAVGTVSISFAADTQTATLELVADGVVTRKSVQRFTDVPTAYGNGQNYRGLWWVPSESGWGFAINQRYQTLFSVMYTYDRDGSLLWVVMPGGKWTNEFVYEGALYTAKQAPWNPSHFSPAATQLTEVGNAKLTFVATNRATLTYTIKGITDSKQLERYDF